ncbi:MAG: hypothetical protein IPK26_06815 [Planctomycetes bacterium]|nr:hypothetical protein [Planctomycetota bacterium]
MSSRRTFVIWILVCILGHVAPGQTCPWETLRFAEGGPQTRHGERWHTILEVDGIPVADLIATAKKHYDRQWQKRFAEDLVSMVMARHGHRPGAVVDVKLQDPDSGQPVLLTKVPMTASARRQVWETWQDETARLAQQALLLAAASARTLTATEWQQDLQSLRTLLDERFAYRHRHPIDIDALFAKAQATLTAAGPAVTPGTLTAAIRPLVGAFGDGHAQVVSPAEDRAVGWLPFVLDELPDGLVATRSDAGGLIDEQHPFVVAIDARPIADWLTAAQKRGNAGSAAFERRQAVRALRDLAELRTDLDLPTATTVAITFAATDGRHHVTTIDVATRRPRYPLRPPAGHRRLTGDIGYLRLPSMDDEPRFLDGIDEAMRGFADAKGLIVDVRGNGGGSRQPLRRLMPWLLAENAPPLIANVAAARLAAGAAPNAPAGYLADRFAWPANWPGWQQPARDVIAAAAAAFVPEWSPPAGAFSDWHWLVLARTDNPNAGHFAGPVVVLQDTDCFSATDIFLAALDLLPAVTLIGTPSGGGSGRAETTTLPHSLVQVRLATMVSYRPDGRLYDGRGIAPDVLAMPTLDDLAGRTDSLLERALAHLRAMRR